MHISHRSIITSKCLQCSNVPNVLNVQMYKMFVTPSLREQLSCKMGRLLIIDLWDVNFLVSRKSFHCFLFKWDNNFKCFSNNVRCAWTVQWIWNKRRERTMKKLEQTYGHASSRTWLTNVNIARMPHLFEHVRNVLELSYFATHQHRRHAPRHHYHSSTRSSTKFCQKVEPRSCGARVAARAQECLGLFCLQNIVHITRSVQTSTSTCRELHAESSLS